MAAFKIVECDMDELKPCPFCGGDDMQLSSHSGYRARMSPTGEIFSIRCLDCGVTFPSEYKKDLLTGKWNARKGESVQVQDKHTILANHLKIVSDCIMSVPVPELDRSANIKMRDAILNVMASSIAPLPIVNAKLSIPATVEWVGRKSRADHKRENRAKDGGKKF